MSVKVDDRHVPDTPANAFLEAGVRAKALAVYTYHICGNEKTFPLRYKSLTNDLTSFAKRIYLGICRANDVRVIPPGMSKEDLEAKGSGAIKAAQDSWLRRSEMQREAIGLCVDMKRTISLAKRVFHLRGKREKYWLRSVSDVCNLLKRWHAKDVERYASIGAGGNLTLTMDFQKEYRLPKTGTILERDVGYSSERALALSEPRQLQQYVELQLLGQRQQQQRMQCVSFLPRLRSREDSQTAAPSAVPSDGTKQGAEISALDLYRTEPRRTIRTRCPRPTGLPD